MSPPVLALLLLLTPVAGAQGDDLRATLLRTGQPGERAAAFAALRKRPSTAADLVDALVAPADLPTAEVREIVRGLLDNLPAFARGLVEAWRNEPVRRVPRGPAFLALGVERLTMLWQLEAADRADVERVLAGGDVGDFRAIQKRLASARNQVLIPASLAIARAMVAAPHPVDALDLSLLSRVDDDPDVVHRQRELFVALRPHRSDPRAAARFAPLLGHADARVRARGSFLLRHALPPIDVLAVQATDVCLPWEGIRLGFDTASIMRVLVPAIAARGPDAVPQEWLHPSHQLPRLSVEARQALVEALLPALFAPGKALTAARVRRIGHLAGDQGHARRVLFAHLLIRLGAGARALHATATTPARPACLALLDPQCAAALANEAEPADLRRLWSTDDPAVRAGIAALLAHRREALPELAAAIEVAALAAMTADDAAGLGCADLDHISSSDEGPPPTSADARLALAAGRLGCLDLFEPLAERLEALPERPRAEDPPTTFVLRLATELGPWLDGPQATRLFDALDRRLTALPGSDSPYPAREAVEMLAAIGGLATSLPDAQLAQFERRCAVAAEHTCIAAALPRHGPPLRRARALWLLDHWPPSLTPPIRLLRLAPEWLATAWHSDETGRRTASQLLETLCAEDPRLVAAWHGKRLLPPGLLGSALVARSQPPLELLAVVAETPSPMAWSDAWPEQVAALDPIADATMLQRFAETADPRFAAAAAATLVRGGGPGRDLGLPILERLAADRTPTTVAETLRRCAAAGITSPALLAIARANRHNQDYVAMTAQALLQRTGELDFAQLRRLQTDLAVHILILAQVGLPHEQLARLDPHLTQGQRWWQMSPALQSSVLQVAERTTVEVYRFVDLAVMATASADPELRRAAYHFLGTIDPRVFPQAALAGEWREDAANPTGR